METNRVPTEIVLEIQKNEISRLIRIINKLQAKKKDLTVEEVLRELDYEKTMIQEEIKLFENKMK